MADIVDYDTGLPAPKVQDLFDKVEIDDAVVDCLPPGHIVTSALPLGASFWTRTARINISDEVGKAMCFGEYDGVKELYKIAPNFVPRPVGCGTYRSDPNARFYLADFVDMIEEHPDMAKFCSALAKLYTDSMKLSDGHFGFSTVTYSGSIYQAVGRTESWEELWIESIKAYAEQEYVCMVLRRG